MVKPNWDIFKAKFSENPQSNFQWLSYLLFCKEFNIPLGLSAYQNQRHIETNPVAVGVDIVGWQAKFYDTPLTSHKAEIIELLEGSKKDYPNLTKVILYTNKDWGQGKNHNDPQQKIDIDSEASRLGITIDWNHTGNFFGSPFVADVNQAIAQHFFDSDASILDLLDSFKRHTESILSEISSTIAFKGKDIVIDRSECLDQLKSHENKISIVSGAGGTGKTALIKDYYSSSLNTPFFIFKATEFNLRNVDELFSGLSIKRFAEFFQQDAEKLVVIDSAEKLVDLPNTQPFKEFLSYLTAAGWRIFFTTRNEYLDVLNADFLEVYKIIPANIHIPALSREQLQALSVENHFSLPSDDRLANLLCTPFYLSEFLNSYKQDEELDYIGFKRKIWNKTIVKSTPQREQCFLDLAWKRTEQGSFYVNADGGQSDLCNALKKDGVLGYESPHGYFITHDIYEEWALEKIVEREFLKRTDNKNLFTRIGQSLPIRRSFRKWLEEKLLLKDGEIVHFIEETIQHADVPQFWKDEILISVLRSEYANVFFEEFKEQLLSGGFELLKKITFLLRIACKETDHRVAMLIDPAHIDLSYAGYILTKPSGSGWKCLISFVADNLERIGMQNLNFILPIIYDWNRNFRTGEITRVASKIALQYYQWITEEDVYVSDDEFSNKILDTILFGTSELKSELGKIFDEVLRNGWKRTDSPYYELCKKVLTKLEGISVAIHLPSYVLQLADLFWTFTPTRDWRHSRSGIDIGEHFNLEPDYLRYYPASAYQTPIYTLLQVSLQETLNFVLKFTNKAVRHFAKSELARYEVREIELNVEPGKPQKQWMSPRLWCMYRGTQVAPHVLEALHMALEKFFLEQGKHCSQDTLESWLIYLLSSSESASITGVVASIVLAYPEKTFNVAKILFRTKELFFIDTARHVADQSAKSMFQIGYTLGDAFQRAHQDERIESCDAKHRSGTLENLFLKYQLFRAENTTEAEADKRRKDLEEILDNYYKELPATQDETEGDKIWRLYLARMDRRKMNLTTEKTEDGILIHLNPEMDSELKKYSEESLSKITASNKYSALRLWANHRINENESCKRYQQYESDPLIALGEAKEIIENLKTIDSPDKKSDQDSEEQLSCLLNRSVAIEVCAVLIKFFPERLSQPDATFCKELIVETVNNSLSHSYHYQISDGVSAAISALPELFTQFPSERTQIKTMLMVSLFNDSSVNMAGSKFSGFASSAIHAIRRTNPEDADSILFGFLIVRPLFEELLEQRRAETNEREDYNYTIDEDSILKDVLNGNADVLQKMAQNTLTADDLSQIDGLELAILQVAFELVPVPTTDPAHKTLSSTIITVFASKLLCADRSERAEYPMRHDFLRILAPFVLGNSKEEIKTYISPFIDGFKNVEPMADLFEEFVLAQDRLAVHDKFWEVWNLFKEKIIELGEKGDRILYGKKILKSYLFAQTPWKEGATEWHTVRISDGKFFKSISQSIGHCASVLYAISKLLNDVGSVLLDEGIGWISHMVGKSKFSNSDKLEVNTVYHLESICRKYVYRNRESIRKTTKLKNELLVILDFLIEKGSVPGYMLRENIL